MISFGTRITDLKREAIRYVTEKVKNSGLYRNKPGDLEIRGERCFIVHTDGKGTIPLDSITLERIGEIADKAQFRPVKYAVEGVTRREVKKESPQPVPNQEKEQNMGFEIKQNIPLPGHVFDEGTEMKAVHKRSKHTNYRALPLKELKVGDCIIVHETDEKTISSRLRATKVGVEQLVKLMDTKKKFKVAKTDDFKVGVWRTE